MSEKKQIDIIRDIAGILNYHGQDSLFNIPDFLLAEMLYHFLEVLYDT